MRLRAPSASLVLDLFGLCLACFSALFLVSLCVYNAQVLSLHPAWGSTALAAGLAAMAAYALAHVLRAIRLWLLLGSDRLGFSTVFGCHATIALVTFATPFKLGDLLRAAEFSRLLCNDARGLFAVWLDRLFDVTVILAMLVGLVLLRPSGPPMELIFLSLGGFLLSSILLGMLLPGAVAALMRALLQSRSKRSLTVLRGMRRLRRLLGAIPRIDLQTLSLLCIVTFAVWGLELAMVFLLLIASPTTGYTVTQQALDTLSNAIMAQPHSHVLQLALYRSICLLTLGIMAALGGGSYARLRLGYRPGRHPAAPNYRYTPPFQGVKATTRGRTR
ncbi:flippase-like domain-containing protein [Geomonas nitrogeniifigens]|uniref:lysylphosphatidylglycerol synthase domain-containing protein n=1 Tax=Geomonas diazotrophica TaxID=2843197 RepID=UPI001C2BE0CE|nr:lysylphosphatidylglycerol synthase domain-containing protein [Geomonas nitrogeniifigens]QXE85425.1 flippase-like domain-containing protein [Geomonas nitrogeniifigens]